MALVGLKRPDLFSTQMHAGMAWEQNSNVPLHEIAGRKVGILGCGYVGQRSARLFKAVGADVFVYDPYLSRERAQEMGVAKAELETCSRYARLSRYNLPSTAETRQLLSAEKLALIQDGSFHQFSPCLGT